MRPENTIPSFAEAIRAGADYIELDVYATKDNHLIVAHDPTVNLENCKGSGVRKPLRSLTFAELRQYDCGQKNAAYPKQSPVPGTPMPSLDEVFDLALKHPRVKVNVEIKSNEKWKDYTPEPEEFCRMVAAAIRARKMEKRVLVQSFDFRIVKAMKRVAPEFELAALYGPGERSFVDIAQETGVRMVNPNWKLVTAEKVKAAHDAGIRIMAWTVDTPEGWEHVLAMGVDGIITNDPEALIGWLKRAGRR